MVFWNKIYFIQKFFQKYNSSKLNISFTSKKYYSLENSRTKNYSIKCFFKCGFDDLICFIISFCFGR